MLLLSLVLSKIYSNTLLYVLNRQPISDPRYASESGGTSSSLRAGKSGHNASSFRPTFAPNHGQNSSSAPRVQQKDPYASQMDGDLYETKWPSLTEPNNDVVG